MLRPLLPLTALVALANSGPSPKNVAHVCPNGATKVGAKCYFVSLDAHPGLGALQYCQGKGGHPAVVESPEEMELLKSLLLETSVFLGINMTNRTQIVESVLKSSGHSGYTNFFEEEPNNSGGEDCVVAQQSRNFQWEDVSCSSTYQVLCETDTLEVPIKCRRGEHLFEEEWCFWVAPTSNFTWLEADVLCKGRQSELASIHSAKEQAFVGGIVPNQTWIGLTDVKVEGDFVWSDGTALDFEQWRTQQPDNMNNEDCVVITASGNDFRWNDGDCQSTNGFVCKTPLRL